MGWGHLTEEEYKAYLDSFKDKRTPEEKQIDRLKSDLNQYKSKWERLGDAITGLYEEVPENFCVAQLYRTYERLLKELKQYELNEEKCRRD